MRGLIQKQLLCKAVAAMTVIVADVAVGNGIMAANDNYPKSLNRNLVYDLDGDGIMSIVENGYRKEDSEIWVYNYDAATKSLLCKKYPAKSEYEYAWKYSVGDIANVDNSGTGVFIRDSQNGFRFLSDGTVERIALPCVKFVVDADADGLMDFYGQGGDLYNRRHVIHYRQSDGTYVSTSLKLTTNKEDIYNSAYYFDPMNFNIPSLKNGWMIGGYEDSKFDNISAAVDLTKNGVPDLLDTSEGGILYNISDGVYYSSPERGVITECDLNGDGILDYVLFDNTEGSVYLMLYDGNGGYSQKLLMNNMNISAAYCRDFDGDGDIDILLPFDYDESAANSFVVFYRNDGNNTFKKKESGYSNQYRFLDCRDVDGDGKYELICEENLSGTDTGNRNLVQLKCNDDFSVSEPVILQNVKSSSIDYFAGDIDNDGITEYFYSNNDESSNVHTFTGAKNTAPDKMPMPTAYYDGKTGKVRITWQSGNDAQTSPCDLTYELRIGSAPGTADILGTISLSDGRRRSLKDGNAGRNLLKWLNPKSLADGKYYIAVQAIDAGGLGGPWSDEFVYEHRAVKADFSMSLIEMSTADTLRLVANPVKNASYIWNVGKGVIVNQENNIADVTFDRFGSYDISLTVNAGGRTLVSDAKSIDVMLFKSVDGNISDAAYGQSADFNQDGSPDLLKMNGVLSNNGKGELTKVAKTYNSDLKGSIIGVLDFNRDGYPDFLKDEDKGNVFINTEEGDFDFEYEKKNFVFGEETDFPSNLVWTDTNNDGLQDAYNGDLYFNKGDNLNYEKISSIETPAGYYYVNTLRDVNRDGFPDIVTDKVVDLKNNLRRYYVLLKDSTANHSYTDPVLLFECEYVNTLPDAEFFGDLNSDGYLDLVLRYKGENFLRVIKGVPQSQWPGKEEAQIPLVGDYNFEFWDAPNEKRLLDFDNNGYPDIMVTVDDSSAPSGYEKAKGILLMQPDFKATLYRTDVDIRTDWDFPFISFKNGDYPALNRNVVGKSTNKVPEKPAYVAVKQIKEGLRISWSDANDDSTPAMQMRYNVSVKKKGKTGNDSFLISPMNALDDKATPVTGYGYKQSSGMIVPISVLEAGQTYEIQVQAIDMWNANSPMTDPVEFTVNSDGYIQVVEKAAVGKEVSLEYFGTKADSFEYDLDGGTLVSDMGNGKITAKWTTSGVKNIVLKSGNATVKTTVTIVDLLDVDFDLPERIIAGAPIMVKVPDAMNDPSLECGFRSTGENVMIGYQCGDTEMNITFPERGTYEIESYAVDAIAGNACKRTVTITDVMPDAEITSVAISGTDNNYVVNWDAASIPSFIDNVIVEKETNKTDEFAELAVVDASTGMYFDTTSQPDVVSARYRIKLVADNGQISSASTAHRPLHVMINKSASGGYNLMWNAYEGLKIDNYTILRGKSADALTELSQISGSLQSYTDKNAPDGELFYAVQFTPAVVHKAKGYAPNTTDAIKSNVISTNSALQNTVYAAEMKIMSVEDEMALTKNQGGIHLFVDILPAAVTFNRVAWSVVSGEELAVIDQNGILRATGKGNGNVVVRATAIDGSGVTAEAEISCVDADGSIAEIPDSDNWNLSVRYINGADAVTVSGWNPDEDAVIYVVASNGVLLDILRTSDKELVVDCEKYPKGIYFVKVVTDGESRAAKFICK